METWDAHEHDILFYQAEQGDYISTLELLRPDKYLSQDELNKTLMSTCRHGHQLLVEMLVGRGVDVNYRDTNGNTPLLISVQKGFTGIVQFLLRNKAHINACNSVGDSALIISIRSSGSRKITENLLKQTEENSVLEVIQVLLENGASVNDKWEDGKTPLMLAAEKDGNTSVLQLLLEHGAELGEVDEEGNTALMHAVQNDSLLNVIFQLQFMKDREELLNLQNDEGLTALMLAGQFRSPAIIKELIDQGADVNIKDRKGNTALFHVVLGDTEQFQISFAASFQGIPRVKQRRGRRRWPPSYKDEDEMITSLVQAGCDINWQNNDGISPLMVAAQKYFKRTMRVLLDSGAEINAVSKTDDTKTALTHLLYREYEDDYFSCLECLLDRGASSSYMEAATFHRIIVSGRLQIVPKLLSCGLGPVNLITSDMDFSGLVHKIMYSHITHSVDNTTHSTSSYSPLCTALCAGKKYLADYFVGNLFLTQSDISSLGRDQLLREQLERRNFKQGLEILNKISTQPMSLCNLSFVAVTTAVGTDPGREIRVDKLPVPQIIKDKLLFKEQDVALTFPETDFRPVYLKMFTCCGLFTSDIF